MISKNDIQKVDMSKDTWEKIFQKYEANFDLIVEEIINSGSRTKMETLTVEEGQTEFYLTKGKFRTKTNSLIVFLNGVRQFVGEGFNETSDTSFAMAEPCREGDIVKAIYTEYYNLDDISVHAENHHAGSSDALDIADLADRNGYIQKLIQLVEAQG